MIYVNGAVNAPMSVTFMPGKGLDYYVAAAGGYTRKADKDRAYVTQPTGKVESVNSHWWFFPDSKPAAARRRGDLRARARPGRPTRLAGHRDLPGADHRQPGHDRARGEEPQVTRGGPVAAPASEPRRGGKPRGIPRTSTMVQDLDPSSSRATAVPSVGLPWRSRRSLRPSVAPPSAVPRCPAPAWPPGAPACPPARARSPAPDA